MVTLFGNGKQTGDSERILLAANAVRNSVRLNGDEAATRMASIYLLRIKDGVGRGEPAIFNLRPAGGKSIGHAIVAYGYESDGTVHCKDPGRPKVDISYKLTDMLLNFAPYGDLIQFSSIRMYIEKIVFTCRPRLGFHVRKLI